MLGNRKKISAGTEKNKVEVKETNLREDARGRDVEESAQGPSLFKTVAQNYQTLRIPFSNLDKIFIYVSVPCVDDTIYCCYKNNMSEVYTRIFSMNYVLFGKMFFFKSCILIKHQKYSFCFSKRLPIESI